MPVPPGWSCGSMERGEAGRVHLLSLFDDGRVLIARPDGQGGITAPVERRLTAAGVELVRAELAATGLTDTSAAYMPVANPGVEPPGYGGIGPSLEVGLPDGGTAVITWFLFGDIDQDWFRPQPEAEALEALAARLSTLEDWLPADAWVDVERRARLRTTRRFPAAQQHREGHGRSAPAA